MTAELHCRYFLTSKVIDVGLVGVSMDDSGGHVEEEAAYYDAGEALLSTGYLIFVSRVEHISFQGNFR